MTLFEMKQKVLGLIEELNPDSEYLTDDPDIATKINDVINQVAFELARIKKIAKYIEIEVKEGDRLNFEIISNALGYEVFQISNITGVDYEPRANGTIIKCLEDGIAEIDVYVYPERITSKTKDKAYEFELSQDVLEVMPYGVAGDLLKSDVSTQYGTIYSSRYESMLQRLDPRNAVTSITFEGGVRL